MQPPNLLIDVRFSSGQAGIPEYSSKTTPFKEHSCILIQILPKQWVIMSHFSLSWMWLEILLKLVESTPWCRGTQGSNTGSQEHYIQTVNWLLRESSASSKTGNMPYSHINHVHSQEHHCLGWLRFLSIKFCTDFSHWFRTSITSNIWCVSEIDGAAAAALSSSS